MADPVTEEPQEQAPEAEAAPRKRRWLLIAIVAAVLVLAGGGGAAWYFMGSDHEADAADAGDAKDAKANKGKAAKAKATKKKAPDGPAIYASLDPPFVVNFESEGLVRFLQVTVQAMSRDQETIDLIKRHDPVIRNNLLLLLSGQEYQAISTREGKEQLRAAALAEVRKVLEAEGGEPDKVEAVYFTSFVMQ